MHYAWLSRCPGRRPAAMTIPRALAILSIALALATSAAESRAIGAHPQPPMPKPRLLLARPLAGDGPVLPSPDVRKEKIRDILARREFAGAHISLWDRFVAWMGHKVERAVEWIVGKGAGITGASQFLSGLLAVVVVVLFLVLLAYVLARVGAGGLLTRPAPETEETYRGPGSSKRALEEAARMAAAGDFRSALRLAYLAALLKLDEQELIRFDRTGTNWEYLAAIRSHPELYRALQPVTLTFDRKWYGREPAGESDYHGFVEAYRAVEAFGAGQ